MHPTTAETEIPAAGAPATYASLGARFVALILDGLAIFGFLFFLLGSIFAMLLGGTTDDGFELTGIAGGLFIAVEILLVMGYYVVSEARWGATLGKLAAGIRVQSTAGQRIGYGAAFIRNLLRIVDILPFFYLTGAISVMLTKRNQRLGDLAAGTVVVRGEYGRGARVAAWVAALALCVGGFLLGMLVVQGDAAQERAASAAAAGAVAPDSTRDAATSESDAIESTAATPWSSRGWVQREDDTFTNPQHDLKLVVPEGWVIVDEETLDSRYLWMMAKLGPDGEQRLMMNILTEDTQGMSAEEWFRVRLQGIRDFTLTIGDETQPYFEVVRAGETGQPDVYEIRFLHNPDATRAHQLYFVRDGLGYIVSRNASEDAGADELADLELIRQSMDLR